MVRQPPVTTMTYTFFLVFLESKHKEKPSCAEAAHKIIEAAMSDSSLAYSRLGYMCNTFGNR